MTTYVYISAALEYASNARALASVLFDAGYRMTSTWYAPTHDDPDRRSKEKTMTREERAGIASINEMCIMNANVMVTLISPKIRGTLVEFGIARGRKMPIIVAGDPAPITLMLDLPGVWFVSDVNEVLRVMPIALGSAGINE